MEEISDLNGYLLEVAQVAGVLFTNKALVQYNLQNYFSAIENCFIALEFNSNNHKTLYRRALCYQVLEQYRLAKQDLYKARALLISCHNPAMDFQLTQIATLLEQVQEQFYRQVTQAKEALLAEGLTLSGL